MFQHRILVVGGGIAGLAVTVALNRHGIRAEVVERGTPNPAGTGLFLPANAVRALTELGVDIRGAAQRIECQHFLDQHGAVMSAVDLAEVWGLVGDSLAIRRTDLHRILLNSVAPGDIRHGIAVVGLDNRQVTFDDGTTRTYDLVIGADGLHSTIRRLAFPCVPIEPLGQDSWRFIAPGFPELTGWRVRLATGRSLLTIALTGGDVYCYADVDSARFASVGKDWRLLFADFGAEAQSVLAHGADAYATPIRRLRVNHRTGDGLVLIGDAANASSPNMAQGAATALEDGLVLAELLALHPVDQALEVFQQRRRPRVRWMHQQAERRDRTRGLPTPLRRALLKTAASRIVRANYTLLRDRP